MKGVYLLGTSIARPLISKVCLQVAREVEADAYAHGATGKGNDQCRFQLAAEALEPGVKSSLPWRIEKFRKLFPGRTEMIAYCDEQEHSGEGVGQQALQLRRELPAHQLRSRQAGRPDGQRRRYRRVRHDRLAATSARQGRNRHDRLRARRAGRASTASSSRHWKWSKTLNNIGGRNGIGHVDMVENRFVGMKSRGVYEAPGMTILYTAHRLVEQLTMDRDLTHLRDRLAPEVAEMVYYGFWYHAKMDALLAFIHEAQKTVTGEVTLNLYKGNIIVASRSSPNSLYDEGIATMEGGGSYNQTDAEGFLRIQGLPGPRAGTGDAAEVLTPLVLQEQHDNASEFAGVFCWPRSPAWKIQQNSARRICTTIPSQL